MMNDRTKGTYFFVFLNSAFLFITANLLENLLHQSGHFFMTKWAGIPDAIMHHNYVSFDESQVSNLHKLLVHAAGPMVSLLTGVIFQLICLRRFKYDLTFLFFHYLSVFGYISFFGYLIIAPFHAATDSGRVFQLLNFPFWVVIIISLMAVLSLYVIMFRLTRNFVAMCPLEALEIKYARHRFIYILVFYPFVLGIICITLLSLPVSNYLNLLPPFIMPFAILLTFSQALNKEYRGTLSNENLDSINNFRAFPLIALIIMLIVNRILAGDFSY